MPSLLQYHWVDIALINLGAGFSVENSPLVTAAKYSVLLGSGLEPQSRTCFKAASGFSKCFFHLIVKLNHDLSTTHLASEPGYHISNNHNNVIRVCQLLGKECAADFSSVQMCESLIRANKILQISLK